MVEDVRDGIRVFRDAVTRFDYTNALELHHILDVFEQVLGVFSLIYDDATIKVSIDIDASIIHGFELASQQLSILLLPYEDAYLAKVQLRAPDTQDQALDVVAIKELTSDLLLEIIVTAGSIDVGELREQQP